jgi:hypothetical protein
MKISLQYVSDGNGETTAVQLSLAEWEKLVAKVKKIEQQLKIQSDLQEAFDQVAVLKKKKGKKQTLNEFLNEV